MNTWFIIVFILMWIAGPFTQLLQLVAPALHRKLGMMEEDAFKPEFKWYLLEERAIASADMSFTLAGLVFIVGALSGHAWAIPFGFFTCAIYLYFGLMSIFRWALLGRHKLSPVTPKQFKAYTVYMVLFVVFGLFGMIYLWGQV